MLNAGVEGGVTAFVWLSLHSTMVVHHHHRHRLILLREVLIVQVGVNRSVQIVATLLHLIVVRVYSRLHKHLIVYRLPRV